MWEFLYHTQQIALFTFTTSQKILFCEEPIETHLVDESLFPGYLCVIWGDLEGRIYVVGSAARGKSVMGCFGFESHLILRIFS